MEYLNFKSKNYKWQYQYSLYRMIEYWQIKNYLCPMNKNLHSNNILLNLGIESLNKMQVAAETSILISISKINFNFKIQIQFKKSISILRISYN